MNQQELTTTTNGEFSIVAFCDRHEACTAGFRWAMANCTTMQDVWQTVKPDWLVWVATRDGVLPAESLRRVIVWILEQIQEFLDEPALLQALEICRNWSTTDEATRDRVREAVGQIYVTRRQEAGAVTLSSMVARTAYWSLYKLVVSALLESLNAANSVISLSATTIQARADASEEFMQRAADWLRSNTQPCFVRTGAISEFWRE